MVYMRPHCMPVSCEPPPVLELTTGGDSGEATSPDGVVQWTHGHHRWAAGMRHRNGMKRLRQLTVSVDCGRLGVCQRPAMHTLQDQHATNLIKCSARRALAREVLCRQQSHQPDTTAFTWTCPDPAGSPYCCRMTTPATVLSTRTCPTPTGRTRASRSAPSSCRRTAASGLRRRLGCTSRRNIALVYLRGSIGSKLVCLGGNDESSGFGGFGHACMRRSSVMDTKA